MLNHRALAELAKEPGFKPQTSLSKDNTNLQEWGMGLQPLPSTSSPEWTRDVTSEVGAPPALQEALALISSISELGVAEAHAHNHSTRNMEAQN